MSKKILSPCISICKTDPITGYCYGCARTENEKKLWKDESTSNDWKIKNLSIIVSRMKGWQLETFKESYDYKIKNGVSIFKKIKLKKIIYNLFSLNLNRLNETLKLHLKVVFLAKIKKLKRSYKCNMMQNLV